MIFNSNNTGSYKNVVNNVEKSSKTFTWSKSGITYTVTDTSNPLNKSSYPIETVLGKTCLMYEDEIMFIKK